MQQETLQRNRVVSAMKGNSASFKCDFESKRTVGWREWVSLPDLEIMHIKAKLDTGARTSALHTYFIEPLRGYKKPKVRFGLHPLQRTNDPEIICTAEIIDERRIIDSGGHPEMRFIIQTSLKMGDKTWPMELSLTNREHMRFRLLLGRAAIRDFLIVDPALSYTLGKPRKVKRNKIDSMASQRKRSTLQTSQYLQHEKQKNEK